MKIPDVVRVLFVEDSQDTIDLVMKLLSKTKYTKFKITHASSLKEGISYFGKKFFDIVLLDMMLPNSKGIQTFIDLHDACVECPVVIISSFDDVGCEAVKRGAQDFILKKDLSSGLMIRSIKYAVERKKLEVEKNNIKQMYEEIVESTNAAIYEICFKKDRLTYVNDVMVRLTGWTRKELLNMSVSKLLTDESKLLWLERYKAMLDGDNIPNTVEYEVNIKDGSTRWVILTASYKLNEKKQIIGARVIALDITDRKRAKIEALYKENLIYNELEQRLITWRKESFVNRQIQERQLRDMDVRITSINNGVV